MKQELQVESLNNCISELQQQAYAQRLELQDAQHGDVESMKRAQELRFDEVSVQKFRENHETIQKLTSQLQETRNQMNSMSDSGEFQEVESNYSGRLSYVPSQPVAIPSSRSMLSRDKRLPLDTWLTSGPQENVFLVINFQPLIRPEIIIKKFIIADHKERQYQFHKLQGLFSQEMDKLNRGTIPMPTFAGRPSTMSSTIPVEFPRKSMVVTPKTTNIGTAIRQIT